jgi:hypothetical protein
LYFSTCEIKEAHETLGENLQVFLIVVITISLLVATAIEIESDDRHQHQKDQHGPHRERVGVHWRFIGRVVVVFLGESTHQLTVAEQQKQE